MAAAAAARPSLRPQFRSRRARGRWRIHLTPFLLNGYPCLLCPCVVCFKFLQPKVIEGKKIDCALADPHLPRLLGGAPQLFTTNLVSPRHRSSHLPRQPPVAATQLLLPLLLGARQPHQLAMPSEREAWVGLESNPTVMTKYARSLGVADGWGFCDLWVRLRSACE